MLRTLLVVFCLFVATSPGWAQSHLIRGDCNGDLAVNVSDPVTLLGLLFSAGSVGCEKACDANDDANVDLADAVYLLAAIFSGGDSPPAPFPLCGPDPTPDALPCVMSPCPDPDPGSNLREVDVAFLGQNTSGNGFLVSIVGSGAQHQLSSWELSSVAGQPTLLETTSPINGHHPKIERLSGLASLVGNPPFVTGRIIDNGDMFLSSRRLDNNGDFSHHGTVGFGSNANLEVLSYALESRSIFNGFFLDRHQVVTPVIVEPTGGGPMELRIVSWQIDAQSDVLTGLEYSDELPVNFPQNITADEAGLAVTHLQGIQYALTYTNGFGHLENHFFWVEDDGHIVYGGGDSGGTDIRGVSSVNVDQEASAVAMVTDEGFVTANRVAGELELNVWERRAEGFLNWEPYHLSENQFDLVPDAKGLFLAAPQLRDSWWYRDRAADYAGDVVVTGDFNGDGLDDAAVGVPNRDNFSDGGGAVYIIQGTNSDGLLDKEYWQVWSQGEPGVVGAEEDYDRFGDSLAVGDFDGDGHDDLAVGVPYEDVTNNTVVNGGAINIIYGSVFGLTASGDTLIVQEDLGYTSSDYDYFGLELVAGDFDGDGRDDLAASAIGRSVSGENNAGVVFVMWGTAGGLSTNSPTVLHQNAAGVHDQAEAFDEFGRALGVGDFDGDGNSDLVVGVEKEDLNGQADAGALHVFYGNGGTATGFSGTNFVSQAGFAGGADIHGALEAGDLFGASFAAGDFDGDGDDELAVGVPGEAVGSEDDAGAVNILVGTFLGLTHIGNVIITLDEFNPTGGNLSGVATEGDEFGFALTSGDYDGDGYYDLLVSAPRKTAPSECGSSSVSDAGVIWEIPGSANGLTAIGSELHTQNSCMGTANLEGTSREGDRFGFSLASGNFNGDASHDVLVGIRFKDRDNSSNTGAVQIIHGGVDGLDYLADEEWFIRERETVRAMVTDMTWEANGIGDGQLYAENQWMSGAHVASVTKVLTLLLAVEAMESGDIDDYDDISISSLAGNTGGSFLELWDMSGPVLNMSGDEIRFIETDNTFPLDLLLHGMMMRSGNRCSVAIGQAVALEVSGHVDDFVSMMNSRVAALNMNDTVCGHPAGGMVTIPQDLITLQMECWQHLAYRQISGAELFGDIAPAIQLCGTDEMGDPKCNSPFTKFQTIGSYPGRLSWKGGNGRLWWSANQPYGNPQGDPVSAPCTSSAVAVVERAGRPIAMALMQTGSRTEDSQRLLDHGVRRLFTPDRCADRDFPMPGGIVGPDGPINVEAFAIDTVSSDVCVTAVIDDFEELRINVWSTDFNSGDIDPLSSASAMYALPAGPTFEAAPLVKMVRVPTNEAIGDYVTANLDGSHLDLEIWRIGENP